MSEDAKRFHIVSYQSFHNSHCWLVTDISTFLGIWDKKSASLIQIIAGKLSNNILHLLSLRSTFNFLAIFQPNTEEVFSSHKSETCKWGSQELFPNRMRHQCDWLTFLYFNPLLWVISSWCQQKKIFGCISKPWLFSWVLNDAFCFDIPASLLCAVWIDNIRPSLKQTLSLKGQLFSITESSPWA